MSSNDSQGVPARLTIQLILDAHWDLAEILPSLLMYFSVTAIITNGGMSVKTHLESDKGCEVWQGAVAVVDRDVASRPRHPCNRGEPLHLCQTHAQASVSLISVTCARHNTDSSDTPGVALPNQTKHPSNM